MVLRCRILGGDNAGKVVFIPRTTLEPSAEPLLIELSCHQFPICLAFAMTINKAQGQSIKYVGIDLCTPVFLMVSSMLLFLAALLQIELKLYFLNLQIQLLLLYYFNHRFSWCYALQL